MSVSCILPELWLKITSELSIEDHVSMMCTCKHLNKSLKKDPEIRGHALEIEECCKKRIQEIDCIQNEI